MEDLKAQLLAERQASYVRLRGGFPIPLAGAVYWIALGIAGNYLSIGWWANIAFFATGAIFPLALLFAAIFRNNFMKDQTAVTSVLVPTFISMLLFWPMAIVAAQTAPEMISLILAIGLSIHWPVIGWSYGRPAIYSAHSIVRAIAVTYIWFAFPEGRLTLLPFAVAATYLLTVLVIFIDSGRMKAKS